MRFAARENQKAPTELSHRARPFSFSPGARRGQASRILGLARFTHRVSRSRVAGCLGCSSCPAQRRLQCLARAPPAVRPFASVYSGDAILNSFSAHGSVCLTSPLRLLVPALPIGSGKFRGVPKPGLRESRLRRRRVGQAWHPRMNPRRARKLPSSQNV